MTITEMQSCAAETLSYFMMTMPDVPFTEDDIVIEFTKKNNMAERAKVLSAEAEKKYDRSFAALQKDRQQR